MARRLQQTSQYDLPAESDYDNAGKKGPGLINESSYDNGDVVDYQTGHYLSTPADTYGEIEAPVQVEYAYGDADTVLQSKPNRQSEYYLDLQGGEDADPRRYDPLAMIGGRPDAASKIAPTQSFKRIQPSSPEEAELCKNRWYKGPVARQDAEAMLAHERDGVFLVRRGKNFGSYVLSIRVQGGYSHLELTSKTTKTMSGIDAKVWVLGAFSQPHESIPAVIAYHRQNEIEIVGKPFVCLRDP